ncbi:MAG: oxygen-independent coproporphyrinogen III oxidase [Flavobacteriia bacterium]|nr:oxygen-independent coproporphyrinogen III oxidase [Flavobacteriia bacterium]
MCSLVQKYNVAGPRYTSYPTVPYWDTDKFSLKAWKEQLVQSFKATNAKEGMSLYIHLPFCESLCTFCGCHKRITKRHELELPYIQTLLEEWQLYLDILGERPRIAALHLGGGTPTFFSPESLDRLLNGLFRRADKTSDFDGSFEGHPNNTTQEHLELLFAHGFRRVSFGVQDYNESVQQAIHRIQSFEQVEKVSAQAWDIGYTSVSHDLIYGLPLQGLSHMEDSIQKTLSIKPQRISLYSYAHVPWIKGNGQRGFQDADLPSPSLKRKQYETAKKLLLNGGYQEIGMDHFALPSDSLALASSSGTLHRNFMGYTHQHTELLLGLGMSSISDSWGAFAQNEKNLEAYTHLVQQGILPIFRGHILTEQDRRLRTHISDLMCRFETIWTEDFEALPAILAALEPMAADGLLRLHTNRIEITDKGRPFVRNVCMAFDLRLQLKAPERKIFSMTV